MLAQIKIDEANEANRAASEVVGRGSQNDRARAGLSGVKGVGLKMGDDVVNALKSLVGGGNGQGRAVMLVRGMLLPRCGVCAGKLIRARGITSISIRQQRL
jgi:hypothetical protein